MSTMIESLRAHALELAVLREEAAQRGITVRTARAGFESTIAAEVQRADAAKRAVEAKEAEVRALALLTHEQTQDTKPCGGISIIETTEYTIDDAAALAHAKAHADALPGLVQESLNVSAIKKLAAAGVVIPGVTVTPLYAVRIASDLVKAMEVTV